MERLRLKKEADYFGLLCRNSHLVLYAQYERGRLILFIIRMITDRIGLQSVLLPLIMEHRKNLLRLI